jgi:hypothetical protein
LTTPVAKLTIPVTSQLLGSHPAFATPFWKSTSLLSPAPLAWHCRFKAMLALFKPLTTVTTTNQQITLSFQLATRHTFCSHAVKFSCYYLAMVILLENLLYISPNAPLAWHCRLKAIHPSSFNPTNFYLLLLLLPLSTNKSSCPFNLQLDTHSGAFLHRAPLPSPFCLPFTTFPPPSPAVFISSFLPRQPRRKFFLLLLDYSGHPSLQSLSLQNNWTSPPLRRSP